MTKTQTWNAYSIPPIDFGWQHLKSVSETLSDLSQADYEVAVQGDIDNQTVREFLEGWESAKEAAAEVGWEGDFRGHPCVFWLPSEYDCEFGFVFKQDNNGTSFVISPKPLPHLEQLHET